MSAGRPISPLDLPEGWQDKVLSLYADGGSDAEVKGLIYRMRGSFSNNLWDRWLKDYVEFSETIKKGREIRGNKKRPAKLELHLKRLKQRRDNRKSEYIGANKVVCSLRSLLSIHLKNRGISFSKKTFELLGYSKNDYINNIESKLKDGMNWDNYGDWHIDHIVPISHFDLSDERQIRICWSLDNLDPKWAFDNLSKSNRRVG